MDISLSILNLSQKQPKQKVLSTIPPPPIGGDLFEKEHKKKLIYFQKKSSKNEKEHREAYTFLKRDG